MTPPTYPPQVVSTSSSPPRPNANAHAHAHAYAPQPAYLDRNPYTYAYDRGATATAPHAPPHPAPPLAPPPTGMSTQPLLPAGAHGPNFYSSTLPQANDHSHPHPHPHAHHLPSAEPLYPTHPKPDSSSSSSPSSLPPHAHAHAHAHARAGTADEEELTAEELEQYHAGLLTWDKARRWDFWFRREWWAYYVALVLVVVLVALMAFFHHDIINWLSPFVRRLQSIKYGWLIPVAILFVLSFPPLFGNEIVIILVGVVWGLGVGFAIVAVGMALGEIANYFVFRTCCSTRAERMTRKSLNYACLTQVVREGGFWMAFMIRLSVIPTHLSTVLFAVCRLPFWQYLLALIAGLPKQLIAVYVGVILGGSAGDTSHTPSRTVSDAVFGVTALITLGALWVIYRRMIAVRKRVLIAMRDDLKERGADVGGGGSGSGRVGVGAGGEGLSREEGEGSVGRVGGAVAK